MKSFVYVRDIYMISLRRIGILQVLQASLLIYIVIDIQGGEGET